MDWNEYDPGPTKLEQGWIDRAKQLETKLAATERRVAYWKEIAELRDKMLLAYRTGRRPAGSTIDRLVALRAAGEP